MATPTNTKLDRKQVAKKVSAMRELLDEILTNGDIEDPAINDAVHMMMSTRSVEEGLGDALGQLEDDEDDI